MTKINLSTNMNAYYPTAVMRDAFIEMANDFNKYPSYQNTELDQLVYTFFKSDLDGNMTSLNQDNTYFCNGTTEAFDFLVRALKLKTAAVFLPTYWGYEVLLKQNNYKVSKFYNQDAFSHNVDDLSSLASQHDIIFICNPNNPTLSYIDPNTLSLLLDKNPNCHFIIDETMLIFDAQFTNKSCINLIAKHSNVTVLVSFSKIFALGGLRAGAIMSNSKLINALKAIRIPYSTPSITQRILTIALTEKDYLYTTLQKIEANQTYLVNALQPFCLDILKRHSNFILLKFKDDIAHKLYKYLLSYDIIVRDLIDKYPELNGEWLRITIGTTKQCQTLASMIQQFFETSFDKTL